MNLSIQAHRDYWFKTIGRGKPESKVPDLEVYIIGVWPSNNDDVHDGDVYGLDPKSPLG
jgi:hypothetical protein